MLRYPFKVKQGFIRGEQWCPDVNTSSGSWKPEAPIEIPNCIKGHCPSLSVCVPNPVLAMFHYLNYYHLAQRWTQPRTPPENHWWVEEGVGAVKRRVPSCVKNRMKEKEKETGKGGKNDGEMITDRESKDGYDSCKATKIVVGLS